MKCLLLRILLAFVTFSTGVLISPSKPAGNIPPVESTSSRISEIKLKRLGCYGSCPVYEVTLRNDGTATFIGYANVSRIGTYHASEYQFNFDKLADWIEHAGFFELENEYARGWVDAEVVSTSVVNDSIRKTVMTYNSGEPPTELWAIDAVIDGVVARIDWEKN